MRSLQRQKINALITAVIICVSVVTAGFVYIPKLMNMDMYVIETGSMEPTIKINSVIFVKKAEDFDSFKVNDIVTFTDDSKQKSFTHRIIEIDEKSKTFITKGDANSEPDIMPTSADYAVGTVQFAVPYLGYVVKLLHNTIAKIVIGLIYVAWAAIEIELFRAERKKNYD